jgi:uncharacterized membrane protein
MDDKMRVSDADRDRVASALREHFAAGRLTPDELDERVSAALNAKTAGELRRVMADLPGPGPVPPSAQPGPVPAAPRWPARRPGLRFVPLIALALLAGLAISGGPWLIFGIFRFFLMFWLIAAVAGIFAAGRMRRRMRYPYRGRPYSRW